MKIAIVKLSAMGDIIHAMAVLQFIKKHLPDSLIDWVVEADFAQLLAHNPHINQIHCVHLKQAKAKKSIALLWQTLKKVRHFGPYDLVIDAQGLLKSAIIAKGIPSKQIWGFDKPSIREPIACYFYTHTVTIAYGKNTIDRNITLVSNALNMRVSHYDMIHKQPFLFSDEVAPSKQIVFVLGASFPSKQYPVEQFAQVAHQLDICPVVVWGNVADYQLACALKRLAPSVQISKQRTLSGLIALIAGARLVIGGDTGPTHMAWALNTPSITLFGATPAYRNAYQTPINKVIASASLVNSRKIDKQNFSIKNISVQAIVKIAKELLALV